MTETLNCTKLVGGSGSIVDRSRLSSVGCLSGDAIVLEENKQMVSSCYIMEKGLLGFVLAPRKGAPSSVGLEMSARWLSLFVILVLRMFLLV